MNPKIAQVLVAMSGLPTKEVDKVWEEVKANHAKLDGCPIHEFELLLPTQPLRHRYRCKRCGGEIKGDAHHWYERGVADGKKGTP